MIDANDLYRLIESRRDVRAFRGEPIQDETLRRILRAAHHAPSVGFMQPWNFIVIRAAETKQQVTASFAEENVRAGTHYHGERAALYRSLKLEGINEAPVNICVTCHRTRGGPHVLGRNTIVDTDIYSTCCAVENLWLAARAEGIGVGWVSILTIEALRRILGIPDPVLPVAYLCLGYPQAFFDDPELQRRGWAERLPLDDVIFQERWGQRGS